MHRCHGYLLARQGTSVDPDDVAPVSVADAARAAWQHVDTAQAQLRNEATCVVVAAEPRLHQLFENLIRNAVEHGGAGVTVTVGDLDDGFYVEDDGAGLPGADPDRLFESGYTTASEGTGFGLSIVEEIVDAHGWTVSATEEGTGGIRFGIRDVESPPDSKTTGDDAESSTSAEPTSD